MRCLGEIQGRQSAERLVAHLMTLDVSTHIEALSPSTGDQWEIWVRDEDKVELALAELNKFRCNPADPMYAIALSKASRILAEKEKARQEAAKNIHRIDTVVRPSMLGRGPMPLTLTLVVLCVLISLISSFTTPRVTNEWGIATVRQLSFVSDQDWVESGNNPAASIMKGQLWRIITPIFMHGEPLHLAMNLFGLVVLGRLLERLLGTPKYALFVLVLAVVPNLFQGLMPAQLGGSPHFVGISGVVYGFFGYIWVRSTINPSFGINIPLPFIVLAVGSIVVGLLGIFPGWGLADLCHLGGLLVGAAFGYASEQS